MVWEGFGLCTLETGIGYPDGTHSLPHGEGSTIVVPLGTRHNEGCDHAESTNQIVPYQLRQKEFIGLYEPWKLCFIRCHNLNL